MISYLTRVGVLSTALLLLICCEARAGEPPPAGAFTNAYYTVEGTLQVEDPDSGPVSANSSIEEKLGFDTVGSSAFVQADGRVGVGAFLSGASSPATNVSAVGQARNVQRWEVTGPDPGSQIVVELAVEFQGTLTAFDNNSGPERASASGFLNVHDPTEGVIAAYVGSAFYETQLYVATWNDAADWNGLFVEDAGIGGIRLSSGIPGNPARLTFNSVVGQELTTELGLTASAWTAGFLEIEADADFQSTGRFEFVAAYDASSYDPDDPNTWVPLPEVGLRQIVIPEPSTLALLTMGTLSLIAYARRRRRGR